MERAEKWAMTVESDSPPIGARIGEKGVESRGAQRRKKRERARGAGSLESRPSKLKLGEESRKWAMTVESGSLA